MIWLATVYNCLTFPLSGYNPWEEYKLNLKNKISKINAQVTDKVTEIVVIRKIM